MLTFKEFLGFFSREQPVVQEVVDVVTQDKLYRKELSNTLDSARKEMNYNGRSLYRLSRKKGVEVTAIPYGPDRQTEDKKWWEHVPAFVSSPPDYNVYSVMVGVPKDDEEIIGIVERIAKRNEFLKKKISLIKREHD